MKILYSYSFWLLLLCLCGGASVVHAQADVARFKVLVVFSYEEEAPWDIEIRDEIEKVLSPFADLTYFYMDTKVALAGGAAKGAEAFALFQQLKPDGVITVDDNAQSLFVLPYLKNKVTVPIIFCGVNAELEHYGYPTTNISGVLERFHLEESIALSAQLVGEIKTFAFMVKDGPVAKLLHEQFVADKERLSLPMVKFLNPKSIDEAVAMAVAVKDDADLLFLVALWGLTGADETPLTEKEVIPIIAKAFGKATTAVTASAVNAGVLSAVITNAKEHGNRSAAMLLQAMGGVPVNQLPVTRNSHGLRMINISILKQLGITPDPLIFYGAKLVRSE